MPILATYIIPPAHHRLYTVGSACMGYDVYTTTLTPPMLVDAHDAAIVESWVDRARIFGLHATLGDALDFAEETIPEIEARLHWIASRTPPFTLINGRYHDMHRYSQHTLAATFDNPDNTLQPLQERIVTMINVLYRTSPFYMKNITRYNDDDRTHVIRYGVPHTRILDRFNLHFSLATGIPDDPTWHYLKDALDRRTGLFHRTEDRTLTVDTIFLLQQGDDGYFRILSKFPLCN